jgi:hypothetical protein
MQGASTKRVMGSGAFLGYGGHWWRSVEERGGVKGVRETRSASMKFSPLTT